MKKVFFFILCAWLFAAVPSVSFGNAQTSVVKAESFPIQLSGKPVLMHDQVFIPMDSIFKALGFDVQYHSKHKTITVGKDGLKIIFTVGKKEALFGNGKRMLDMAPVIIGGKAYIQSAFIIQEFGTKVIWNQKDNLHLGTGKNTPRVNFEGTGNLFIYGNGMILNILEAFDHDVLRDMIYQGDKLLVMNMPEDAAIHYLNVLPHIPKNENDIYTHIYLQLGHAYRLLAEIKDSAKNSILSCSYYQKAMERQKKYQLEQYVMTLENLTAAQIFQGEITGDKKLMEKALENSFVLERYLLKSKDPYRMAFMHQRFGRIYRFMGELNPSQSRFLAAEREFNKVIQQAKPVERLTDAGFELGNVYQQLWDLTKDASYLDKGLTQYQKALTSWSLESYPWEYSKVHWAMGQMYQIGFENEGRSHFAALALEHFGEALKFIKRDKAPFKYAKLNMDIGNVYLNSSEKRKNGSIHLQSALDYFNAKEYPAINRQLKKSLVEIK